MKEFLHIKLNRVIVIYWVVLIFLYLFEMLEFPFVQVDTHLKYFIEANDLVRLLWLISLPYLGIVWAINERQNKATSFRKNSVYTIINILFYSTICIINIINFNVWDEKTHTEYKLVEKNIKVFEKVNNLEVYSNSLLIETVRNKKLWFAPSTNFNYSPNSLNQFLQIGDTIIKHGGSDTIYIHRNKKEYYFVSGANVGKEPFKFDVKKWFKK